MKPLGDLERMTHLELRTDSQTCLVTQITNSKHCLVLIEEVEGVKQNPALLSLLQVSGRFATDLGCVTTTSFIGCTGGVGHPWHLAGVA